mgnify:CR=1 FL=1
MKNNNRLLLILVLIVLILSFSGCAKNPNKANFDSSNTSYELYAYNENGIIQYVQIQKINKANISYSAPKNINIRKKGLIPDDFVETAQKEVYVSIYRKNNGAQLDNRIYVLSHGKIENSIKLGVSKGPNRMISDVGKNKVFVLMAVQPAS